MTFKKKLPKFKDEEEERAFWANEDSTEYIDWSKAKLVTFTSIKPKQKHIKK